VELETIRMLENNEIPSNSRLFETQFDPDAGTMIILMYSVQKQIGPVHSDQHHVPLVRVDIYTNELAANAISEHFELEFHG
jgi:hypothetical protein